jgi:4-amino-4-deoxy-L-arabinose transferase-like glycosyltransferase
VAERLRRIPPGLGALLIVSALLGVIWACLTPAFQAPDEQRHFAYVQSLATRFALPGDPKRKSISTQVQRGMLAMNANQVAAQAYVKPEWDQRVDRAWAPTDAAASRDDGGGPGPASVYPPVSYAWQAIGYLAGSGGSLFDELLGARLMSALWLPVTVLATWLLAGELLGRRRLLQTMAASLPALLPMVAFVSASVSPDGMLYATWAMALWLGVRCVKAGVPVRDGVAFFAVVGLACTVKATSLALLPAAALVALFGILARRPLRVPRVLGYAAAVAIPLAVTLGAWIVGAALLERPAAAQVTQTTASAAVAGTSLREFASYLWQYYLPRVPGQDQFKIAAIDNGYPALKVWIMGQWGAFGWLEVVFPDWVYEVLFAITGAITAAAGWALWRVRRMVDLKVAAFLALVVVCLFAGLHWTDYHQIKAGQPGFNQGRYLFPLLGLYGVIWAGALSLVPAARRGAVAGFATGLLFSWHLLSIGLVLERFYA